MSREGRRNHRILIAVDGSESAMKAVRYAGEMLGPGAQVTLYHVAFGDLPAILETEAILQYNVLVQERAEEASKWRDAQATAIRSVMDRAKKTLIDGGISGDHVAIRIENEKEGVASDILNEVKRGNYDTVVVGRRGLSGVRRFLAGSVSSRIVQHAEGCTVWVVE